MSIPSLGRFDLASRIALDASTGSWFVVGIEHERDATLLGEEVENLTDTPVPVVAVHDRESLVGSSREHAGGTSIFVATSDIQDLHLDDARSLLQREHPAILAIPVVEFARLPTIAPHFMSWVGDRACMAEEDRYLDNDAQEERLAALRMYFGKSDEEFLAQVERGEIALEAEHIEWIVLLDRQDLLGGSP